MESATCTCGAVFEADPTQEFVECPKCRMPVLLNSGTEEADENFDLDALSDIGDELRIEPPDPSDDGYELQPLESADYFPRLKPAALAGIDVASGQAGNAEPYSQNHDERLERIAQAARVCRRRALPLWLGLLDRTGLGGGRFESSRTEAYRVCVARGVTYTLDLATIRELLLTGDLDREMWVRQVNEASEVDMAGEWPGGQIHEVDKISVDSAASDDEIRDLLRVNQLQRDLSSREPKEANSNDESKSEFPWCRIRKGLARSEFSIQVLYHPIRAHIRKGEELGFSLGVIAWVLLPLIGGAVAATVKEGSTGLFTFIAGLLICAIIVGLSGLWMALAGRWTALMWITIIFFGCSPFLPALAAALAAGVICLLAMITGSVVGGVIGGLIGLARAPFVRRAPRKTDYVPIKSTTGKPWPEQKVSRSTYARLGFGTMVWTLLAAVAFSGAVDPKKWQKYRLSRLENGQKLELSLPDEERTMGVSQIAQLELRDEIVVVSEAASGEFTKIDADNAANDPEARLATDDDDSEKTIFLMREIARRADEVEYPDHASRHDRNVDLAAAVYRWPEREYVGTMRVTMPFSLPKVTSETISNSPGDQKPEIDRFRRFDDAEQFNADDKQIFVEHLMRIIDAIKYGEIEKLAIIDTPSEPDAQPTPSEMPPPDEGEPLREWGDTTGKFRVTARLIAFADHVVTLEREDGNAISVPIERLSENDQKYVLTRFEGNSQEPNPPCQ